MGSFRRGGGGVKIKISSHRHVWNSCILGFRIDRYLRGIKEKAIGELPEPMYFQYATLNHQIVVYFLLWTFHISLFSNDILIKAVRL